MPDLKPTTALGGTQAKSLRLGVLSIEENSTLALASLALRRGAAQPSPFGLALPGPGGWTAQGGVAAFWTGSDQWMIEAEGRAESDFSTEVLAAGPGLSVTEQTDGFVAFEIRSDAGEAPILALMSKLVNLDPCRFGPGSATRTGFEHMSVFVIRRAQDHLGVIGMRSAAGTIWHALESAVGTLAEARA